MNNNYFSILAAFKNETKYLIEWIEYHRLVGAEHFYLYNNDDDPREADAVLRSYVSAGIVEVVRWEAKTGNRVHAIFSDGLRRAKGRTVWLAFLDLDEFLHPIVSDSVARLLREYDLPDVGYLVVNWLVFGSSGHKIRQPVQIDAFRRRGGYGFPPNRIVKCIVRPDRIVEPQGSHCFGLIKGFRPVDEALKTCAGPHRDPSYQKIALHHYFCRSAEDMKDRAGRLRLDGISRGMEEIFRHDVNDVLDERICRFLPALRERMCAKIM